ncbi:MAG: SH3 domain-containing protein [Lachnospiraceae bacterium]|nr:SH3 domain-containing protein [Lachnospiraceae bacterium]
MKKIGIIIGTIILLSIICLCVFSGNSKKTTKETTSEEQTTLQNDNETTLEITSEEPKTTDTTEATPEEITTTLEETTTPEVTTTPQPTTQAYTVTKLDKTMYAKSTVNVRKGPSTDFEKVSSLSTGKQVKVIGQSDQTGWYLIQFDGKEGYVSNSYLQDKPVETTTPKPTTTKAPSSTSSKTETTTTQPQTSANPNAYKADKYVIARYADGSYDVKNCILGTNAGVSREQMEKDAADILQRELIRLGLLEIPEGYYLTVGIIGWDDPYKTKYYDIRDWELGVRTDDKAKNDWYWYFDENFKLQKK